MNLSIILCLILTASTVIFSFPHEHGNTEDKTKLIKDALNFTIEERSVFVSRSNCGPDQRADKAGRCREKFY